MDITSITLLTLILLLIIIGLFEYYFHSKAIANIPIRIHVNGTRGKSSVARLIAAGLRGGGLRTFAKTTGTTPRIINDKGKDVELYRLRSASIGEQIKLIRYFSKKNPDAVVMECMAVNPQYQWVSEHKIVRSTLGVITNVRPDHLDEMGTTNKDIAYSLSNTIPFNSKVITSEKENMLFLDEVAQKRNTAIFESNINDLEPEYVDSFPYIEHPDNIALALKVCEEAGVDKSLALKGMLQTVPDPGALFIWNIYNNNNKSIFISGFAANDPSSTKIVWNLVSSKYKKMKSCIFLNTRDDRIYRTVQLLELLFNDIKPDFAIVRADNILHQISKYKIDQEKIAMFDMESKQEQIVDKILELDNYFILGIGNMVGWGEEFIEQIKEYSK